MLDNLSFCCLNAYFEVTGPDRLCLPPYAGSAFRGVLGHAMRSVRYGMNPNCPECPSRPDCRYGSLYAYLFEAPGDHPFIFSNTQTIDRVNRNFPPPFILDPPPGGDYAPGELIVLGITLVGRAISCFPFMACALKLTEQRPLGKGKGRIRLVAVTDALASDTEDEPLVYDAQTGKVAGPAEVVNFHHVREWTGQHTDAGAHQMRITFHTPFRFRHNNAVGTSLTFHIFMRNVFRRLTLLSVHSPLTSEIDHQGLLKTAETVKVSGSDLQWSGFDQYSNRQKDRIRLGGLLGYADFSGQIGDFVPFVRMCEFLNVGKACNFGLGRYQIEMR